MCLSCRYPTYHSLLKLCDVTADSVLFGLGQRLEWSALYPAVTTIWCASFCSNSALATGHVRITCNNHGRSNRLVTMDQATTSPEHGNKKLARWFSPSTYLGASGQSNQPSHGSIRDTCTRCPSAACGSTCRTSGGHSAWPSGCRCTSGWRTSCPDRCGNLAAAAGHHAPALPDEPPTSAAAPMRVP